MFTKPIPYTIDIGGTKLVRADYGGEGKPAHTYTQQEDVHTHVRSTEDTATQQHSDTHTHVQQEDTTHVYNVEDTHYYTHIDSVADTCTHTLTHNDIVYDTQEIDTYIHSIIDTY